MSTSTRPTRKTLSSGIAAWDADVDYNFELLFDKPFTIYEPDSLTDLATDFAVADYENCFCVYGGDLYTSDGTEWSPYLGTADYVADSTATDVATLAADYNTLLAALRASGAMADS